MDATDVFFCGFVWAQTRGREAGLELVRAIESDDPELQSIAQAMLDQAGVCSKEMITGALDAKTIRPLESSLVSFQPGNCAGCPRDFWWLNLTEA